MSSLSPRQVHIDFHTPELPFALGGHFDKKAFQETLLDAHVTSVTLTGRCHHGHIYYDTELPARHPQMAAGYDFLMEEIRACHEVGIKAPVYLTVGWDAWAASRHPEWLERHADGSLYGFENFGQLEPGWKTLCFNSGYLDYLKEVIRDTIRHVGDELDGLFFDIVWQDPCLCESCLAKMEERGLDPASEADRDAFALQTEQMLKREVTATVHSLKPDCEVVFNEGNVTPIVRPNLDDYTHFEIESLPSSAWGYRHFPATVRYTKTLGKPYLGMTARFHKGWADFGSYKNQAALEYETFLAFAHGAACSIGDQMYPDGTLDAEAYRLIGNVYGRLERIEGVNAESRAVSEIAILHPGVVRTSEEKVDPALSGAVSMLSELGYQFDVVDDQADWSRYALMVLPDCITLAPKLRERVDSYLAAGGHVLASYKSGLLVEDDASVDAGCGTFDEAWGLSCAGEDPFEPTFVSCDEDACPGVHRGDIVLHGSGLLVKPADESTVVLGEEKCPMFQRTYRHYYGHYHAPADQLSGFAVLTANERVAYVSHAVFEMYREDGMVDLRSMVGLLINRLLGGAKVLQTDLPAYADTVLNWRDRDRILALNMLYYVPSRRSVTIDTVEDRVPLFNRSVRLDLAACSRALGGEQLSVCAVRDPETSEELSYTQKDDVLEFTVPVIEGYRVLEIVCE